MSKEENTPYSFRGDNAALVGSIKALLSLDAKGALVPNGVGGMARQLLESAVERLGVETQSVQAIPLKDCVPGWHSDYNDGLFATEDAVVTLFTRADAGEAEQLREAYVAAGEREHALRLKLAELDALLEDLLDYDISLNARRRIEEALSASAEPTKRREIPADIAALALELSKGKPPEQVKREVDEAIASFGAEPTNKEAQ